MQAIAPKTENESHKGSQVEVENRMPVLSDEEEQFLHQITSEEPIPPLPARPGSQHHVNSRGEGRDAQIALMDGAEQIGLPDSPSHELPEPTEKGEEDKNLKQPKKKRNPLAHITSIFANQKNKMRAKDTSKSGSTKSKEATSQAVIPEDQNVEDASKHDDDLAKVLDDLNLAAANNRVFSFSKESQELLDKFKLILKDLVNGVPTAYDDLEKLLTNSDGQLRKLYGGLPPFLQNLIKRLPTKMTDSFGPDFAAMVSEKPGKQGSEPLSDSVYEGKGPKIPSLKKLVSAQGAVATMLRSILQFLKFRFPALLTGTNVLMSLAVFVLLFVFWYCHKRGKETRLSKERKSAEDLDSDVTDDQFDPDEGSAFRDIDSIDTNTKETRTNVSVANDSSESKAQSTLTATDLPSVQDLPEPGSFSPSHKV